MRRSEARAVGRYASTVLAGGASRRTVVATFDETVRGTPTLLRIIRFERFDVRAVDRMATSARRRAAPGDLRTGENAIARRSACVRIGRVEARLRRRRRSRRRRGRRDRAGRGRRRNLEWKFAPANARIGRNQRANVVATRSERLGARRCPLECNHRIGDWASLVWPKLDDRSEREGHTPKVSRGKLPEASRKSCSEGVQPVTARKTRKNCG